MNYDQRISRLKDWFGQDIVCRFNMPRDLNPKIVAMDVIEAINSIIPNNTDKEQMGRLLASVTKEAAQSAKTRTLPSTREFIEATREACRSRSQGHTASTATSLDPYQVNANRIRQREPVGDMYLRDPHRKKLIEEYHLTEEDFSGYDKWIAEAAHKQ
jgi:hypothetical protein